MSIRKNYDEDYCVVVQNHGASFRLKKLDGSGDVILGKLRGNLKIKGKKKKTRVVEGSVVLVSNRGFQDSVVDIIHIYTDQEVKQLKKEKAILEEEDNAFNHNDVEQDEFVFDEI